MANEELQQEYQNRKERTATLTNLTLQSTDGGDGTLQPTPTQEENDLLALGLMHPDDKAQPPFADKGMPSLAAQQAYLASGEALPSGAAPAPTPAPKTTTTTTTTAPRTTTSTGTVSSTGTASSG